MLLGGDLWQKPAEQRRQIACIRDMVLRVSGCSKPEAYVSGHLPTFEHTYHQGQNLDASD